MVRMVKDWASVCILVVMKVEGFIKDIVMFSFFLLAKRMFRTGFVLG